MDWDDIVYLTLLFSSIGFGRYLRNIEGAQIKKNVATLAGIFIILFVSGIHAVHPILLTLTNALILKCLSKKIIHKVSFAFSFSYLMFFRTTEYVGIPYPPAHTNLVMMIMVLKLVGLAFEIHDTSLSKISPGSSKPNLEVEASYVEIPSFLDIFHYSFCYIGVLTGPYFTYRMYCDMFNTPFCKYAQCEAATLQRLKYMPMFAVIFLAVSTLYPPDYVSGDEFYEGRTLWYRLWYIVPMFIQFRMRMYIGMTLSECVLTMAGFGAYPVQCLPKPTKGPTANFEYLGELCSDQEKAKDAKYSLDATYNIKPYYAEYDFTVRSSMKSWNISVQYWLATYVYRRFPIKPYRTLITFLVSALWHGVYVGYYFCLLSVPFYLPVEDIYYRNLKDVKISSIMYTGWWFVACQWRMFIMGFWTMSFRLLTVQACLKYWYSVYCIPTLITLVMYAASFVLFKGRSKKDSLDTDRTTKKLN